MPGSVEATGRCASAGRFIGPVHVASTDDLIEAGGDNPDVELVALAAAIEGAVCELAALTGKATSADVIAILEFQSEMLMDPELAEGAMARIGAGEGAALAWVSALDDYITGFRTADDDLVRSRVADLVDIRDRVLARLAGKPLPDFPTGSVFVGADMTPTTFLTHDWSEGGAIVLTAGSSASHVAMLARTRQVPMVVATGPLALEDGMIVGVEAQENHVAVTFAGTGPALPLTRETKGPMVGAASLDLADGTQLSVSVIVNDPADLTRLDPHSVAGVGLLRSEFFIRSVSDLADEERQRQLYQGVIDWAAGRPVTIRLFDLGGDKQVPGLDLGPSGRSMLGHRGVRALLVRPEILRIQTRAILRLTGPRPVRVLVPMVTSPSEMAAVRAIFAEEADTLASRGLAVGRPEIGMMVEVPAAALMLDSYQEADFFSLGTNDLAQYLAACARDVDSLGGLLEETWPALARIIDTVVTQANHMCKPLTLCGDLAGETGQMPALLSLGIRHLAVSPARLPSLWAAMAAAEEGGDDGS